MFGFDNFLTPGAGTGFQPMGGGGEIF